MGTQMEQNPRATYHKLPDGGWGLRVVTGGTATVSPGQWVDVHRLDGKVVRRRVDRVLHAHATHSMCSMVQPGLHWEPPRPPRVDEEFDPDIHTTHPREPIPPDNGTVPF